MGELGKQPPAESGAMGEADKPGLQEEVLAFLCASLPAPIERVDTHAAVVLLAGDRAFKLKRAVRYSFLDFSTLERRRRAFERELELNRRTAPDLYLGILPVVRCRDGSLALGGAGEPVEFLLEMRRFPSEARLDRVAARGGLTAELLDQLADAIVRFHRQAEVHTEAGGVEGMRAVIAGNATDLRALAGTVLEAEAVEELIAETGRTLARLSGVLECRRLAGCVRQCHGDLHLENIVLLDGRPVPFDCIEFDDTLARIDVLYDLAFLLMDLLRRGHAEAAWRLLQTWHEKVGEDVGLATLPFFLSVRAAIRAKVEGLACRLAEEPDRVAGHRAAAGAYLDLARKLLEPAPPRLVVVGGLSGTGKSSVARSLAPKLLPEPGALVLRSDVLRKRLFGRCPQERLPEIAYRAEISQRVFAALARRARRLLMAGRSVVCDAVYGEPWQRQQIEAVARDLGVSFAAFWLEAPVEVLERRVASRAGDASDADIAVLRRQLDHLDTEAVAWPRIDAARPVFEVVADVASRLGL